MFSYRERCRGEFSLLFLPLSTGPDVCLSSTEHTSFCPLSLSLAVHVVLFARRVLPNPCLMHEGRVLRRDPRTSLTLRCCSPGHSYMAFCLMHLVSSHLSHPSPATAPSVNLSSSIGRRLVPRDNRSRSLTLLITNPSKTRHPVFCLLSSVCVALGFRFPVTLFRCSVIPPVSQRC